MIAVLFGPPGSGKGTQAAFITRDFDLAHVSTGDMLRAEAATRSPLGREVAPLMAALAFGQSAANADLTKAENLYKHTDFASSLALLDSLSLRCGRA